MGEFIYLSEVVIVNMHRSKLIVPDSLSANDRKDTVVIII